MRESIQAEVVYALPDRVFRFHLTLPEGSTVAEAVRRASEDTQWPDLASQPLRFGIYSRQVSGDQLLRDGDRVEVYRALQLDPKEARRRRAARGKP